MFIRLNKKAQSTAEYVIVLGLVVAAVVAMQTYIKRGLQGRIRDAVDFTDQAQQINEDGKDAMVQFSSEQYEPYYLTSNFDNTRKANDNETASTGGGVARGSHEENTRTGTQKILSPDLDQ